jgi:hypothetical protein
MPRSVCGVLVGALVLLGGSGCAGTGEVQVQVENAGTVALDSVWLFATGESAFLGTLIPGQRTAVQVRPAGESHLEFTFAAVPKHMVVDTYFEPGYRGPIRVKLQRGRVEVVQHARP